MKRAGAALFSLCYILCGLSTANSLQVSPVKPGPARRVVILMVDGLNADLLYSHMRQMDPETGKPVLPWMQNIFGEHGTVFQNFYTRGISLSAPSWSMLNSGRHTVIRGNAEFDRYTGQVYDYLNFFPFYIGYARKRQEDMPGVEVMDRAGVPLVIDAFQYPEVYQSLQLYQRGVRWETLTQVLKRRFSSKVLLASIEEASGPSLDELLAHQTEQEIDDGLNSNSVLYLDFFTGDVDHEAHATNQAEALGSTLKHLDALAGRLWTAIQKSAMADETLFVVVSDHGMNNVPAVSSQGFSLPDLFNSPQGGAHHVVTNRHQLESFKLNGLDPLVHRVVNPSTSSFYLAGQAADYPTAWMDLDGNERASILLRNSDLNKLHIVLLQLSRPELSPELRAAASGYFRQIIDKHRDAWTSEAFGLREELAALQNAMVDRRALLAKQAKKWTADQRAQGQDKAARRLGDELAAWERESGEYTAYLNRMQALLSLVPDSKHAFDKKISDYIPEMSLGDANTVAQLEHYAVGPAKEGLLVSPDGQLDQERSFRYVNYFTLLAEQRVRNNPQAAVSPRPIDFTAMRLPAGTVPGTLNSYWLYRDEESQLLILEKADGIIATQPIEHLAQNEDGAVHWTPQPWRAGLPLELFEDSHLSLANGQDRGAWLSSWHSEREWLKAIHATRYSNGVIGVLEQLSPVGKNVAGQPGASPFLVRYERRRRELVEPDFQVFAADHWNFNVRDVNPGGNHGSFLRISTHSVWMMAGTGVPVKQVAEPYDSLNFASTVLSLIGKTPPMPERVVHLQ